MALPLRPQSRMVNAKRKVPDRKIDDGVSAQDWHTLKRLILNVRIQAKNYPSIPSQPVHMSTNEFKSTSTQLREFWQNPTYCARIFIDTTIYSRKVEEILKFKN